MVLEHAQNTAPTAAAGGQNQVYQPYHAHASPSRPILGYCSTLSVPLQSAFVSAVPSPSQLIAREALVVHIQCQANWRARSCFPLSVEVQSGMEVRRLHWAVVEQQPVEVHAWVQIMRTDVLDEDDLQKREQLILVAPWATSENEASPEMT